MDDRGTLTIRAPHNLKISAIDKIVKGHQRWIQKKLKEVEWRQMLFRPKQFSAGEKFLYLGKEYPLFLVDRSKPVLGFNGKRFVVSSAHLHSAKAIFEKWYERQGLIYLTERASELSRLTGLRFKNFRVSSARARWGSCSAKGTLSLSWRLMMAPPQIADYVIIHELAHTKEKNHSRAFWEVVGRFVPDYRERRLWLKKNGFLLNL